MGRYKQAVNQNPLYFSATSNRRKTLNAGIREDLGVNCKPPDYSQNQREPLHGIMFCAQT